MRQYCQHKIYTLELKREYALFPLFLRTSSQETGAKTLQRNMELVGPITYTKEELAFGEQIMKEYGLESTGVSNPWRLPNQIR